MGLEIGSTQGKGGGSRGEGADEEDEGGDEELEHERAGCAGGAGGRSKRGRDRSMSLSDGEEEAEEGCDGQPHGRYGCQCA